MKQYLRGSLFTILKLIALITIFITACNAGHWFNRQGYYEGLLPEKIEIFKPILIADHNFLETCNFAVYKLSDKTIDRIDREGLAFFSGATIPRGAFRKEKQNRINYDYYPWKQVISTEISGGSRVGNPCAERLGFDNSILKKKYFAPREGSFYTSGERIFLIVLPNEGIAVLYG